MTHQMVRRIPLDKLGIREPSKRHEDGNKVMRLTYSLVATGQIHPLIVQPIAGTDKFEVIAGGMRLLGLQQAKAVDANCIVVDRELSEAQILELIISENLQRFDPDPMEFSRRVCRYMEASNLNGTETAKRLGMSKTEVSRCRTRVCDWPEELQLLVERGLAPSTAQLIHENEDPEKKQRAMQLAAEGKLPRDVAYAWAQESKRGRPPAKRDNASRVKVALDHGAVTVSGTELSAEGVAGRLKEALKRVRETMVLGLQREALVEALGVLPSSKRKRGSA
jgi:ParB/RepB/Spo0J family partition protein